MNLDNYICEKGTALKAKINELALDAIREIQSFSYYNTPKIKTAAIDGVTVLLNKIIEEIELNSAAETEEE